MALEKVYPVKRFPTSWKVALKSILGVVFLVTPDDGISLVTGMRVWEEGYLRCSARVYDYSHTLVLGAMKSVKRYGTKTTRAA